MGALSNQLTTKGNCCNQAITQVTRIAPASPPQEAIGGLAARYSIRGTV